jgi:hypothetical protein
MQDVLEGATAAGMAVPATAGIAGGVRALSRMPAVGRNLQAFEQPAAPWMRTIYEGVKNVGKAAIPASGKELAAGGALAAGAGAVGGLAKQPIRKEAEALSERTGLPPEMFSVPADIAITVAAGIGGSKLAGLVTGGNTTRAVGTMREQFGDIPERLSQKARNMAFSQDVAAQKRGGELTERAAEAARIARTAEIEHAKTTAEALTKAESAKSAALRQHVGAPKTEDEIGAAIKGPLAEKVDKAYKARQDEATEA